MYRKWEGDRQGTVKGQFHLISEKAYGKVLQIFYGIFDKRSQMFQIWVKSLLVEKYGRNIKAQKFPTLGLGKRVLCVDVF